MPPSGVSASGAAWLGLGLGLGMGLGLGVGVGVGVRVRVGVRARRAANRPPSFVYVVLVGLKRFRHVYHNSLVAAFSVGALAMGPRRRHVPQQNGSHAPVRARLVSCCSLPALLPPPPEVIASRAFFRAANRPAATGPGHSGRGHYLPRTAVLESPFNRNAPPGPGNSVGGSTVRSHVCLVLVLAVAARHPATPPATDRQALRPREANYVYAAPPLLLPPAPLAPAPLAPAPLASGAPLAPLFLAPAAPLCRKKWRPSFLPPPLFMFWRDWVLL